LKVILKYTLFIQSIWGAILEHSDICFKIDFSINQQSQLSNEIINKTMFESIINLSMEWAQKNPNNEIWSTVTIKYSEKDIRLRELLFSYPII
jgi:hypothetical protein